MSRVRQLSTASPSTTQGLAAALAHHPAHVEPTQGRPVALRQRARLVSVGPAGGAKRHAVAPFHAANGAAVGARRGAGSPRQLHGPRRDDRQYRRLVPLTPYSSTSAARSGASHCRQASSAPLRPSARRCSPSWTAAALRLRGSLRRTSLADAGGVGITAAVRQRDGQGPRAGLAMSAPQSQRRARRRAVVALSGRLRAGAVNGPSSLLLDGPAGRPRRAPTRRTARSRARGAERSGAFTGGDASRRSRLAQSAASAVYVAGDRHGRPGGHCRSPAGDPACPGGARSGRWPVVGVELTLDLILALPDGSRTSCWTSAAISSSRHCGVSGASSSAISSSFCA